MGDNILFFSPTINNKECWSVKKVRDRTIVCKSVNLNFLILYRPKYNFHSLHFIHFLCKYVFVKSVYEFVCRDFLFSFSEVNKSLQLNLSFLFCIVLILFFNFIQNSSVAYFLAYLIHLMKYNANIVLFIKSLFCLVFFKSFRS